MRNRRSAGRTKVRRKEPDEEEGKEGGGDAIMPATDARLQRFDFFFYFFFFDSAS